MKHIIRSAALLLAVLMLAVGLCACAEQKTSDGEESYYISYNGTKIRPGADGEGLIDELGEPKSEKNNGNCGGQGVQMKYVYSSFDLYMLESKDGDLTVDQISLKDDLLETPEGICIGSSEEDVTNAYGKPDKTTSETVIYYSGRQELIFGIDDGLVDSIDIIYRTEE